MKVYLPPKRQQAAAGLLLAGFILGLLFYP
jgi:hypothetical protein